MIRRLWQRVVGELIGRARTTYRVMVNRLWSSQVTKDLTRPNYEFWDNARRCNGQVRGLEVSGLLLKPISNKTAAWTFGKLPVLKVDNPAVQEALNQWLADHHDEIITAWEEALSLGDFFVVVNSDLSVSLVTPDTVEPMVAEDDYSRFAGWRVSEKFEHPTELGKWMSEINEYRPDERVRVVRFNEGRPQDERFPNLVGRTQCVHVYNNRQSNELFGKPEGVALVSSPAGLLHRYGEILDAATDGNLRQGRPTPHMKFESVADLDEFYETYGKSITDPETGEKVQTIPFNPDRMVTTAGGGFEWVQPGEFVDESIKLLEVLYWLLLEHTEIPEFVMGTAIASSRASAETQMPVFTQWIEQKRRQMTGWLLELARFVADMLVLTQPGLGTYTDINIVWPSLSDDDGKLTLESIRWAYTEGLLSKRWALMLMPVEIEDVDGVLEEAKREREEERDEAAERDLMQAQVMRERTANRDEGEVVEGEMEAVA